jgi:hypothetical protein
MLRLIAEIEVAAAQLLSMPLIYNAHRVPVSAKQALKSDLTMILLSEGQPESVLLCLERHDQYLVKLFRLPIAQFGSTLLSRFHFTVQPFNCLLT